MIAFIKGIPDTFTDNSVILETSGGVGYEIFISSYTAEQIKKLGSVVRLMTYFHVREDEQSLYGFYDESEKQMFEELIKVSGIGPKGAINILSGISVNDLCVAIMSDDKKTISKCPGIGAKTAERICLELKKKASEISKTIFEASFSDDEPVVTVEPESKGAERVSASVMSEGIEVLVALGYSNSQAYKMVHNADLTGKTTVEEVVKAALSSGV